MKDDFLHWFTGVEVNWLLDQDAEVLESGELVFSIAGGASGERLYPSYQFDPDSGRPWPVIRSLLDQFRGEKRRERLSQWLEKPCKCLCGRPPATLLGSDPEQVLAAARRFLQRR